MTDLDYADDIALLASSLGDLQSMVSRVNEVEKSVGLSINAGKIKVFSSRTPDQKKAPLGIDGCQLEEEDSFKSLGARLLPNGQSKDDIVSRIDAARWVFSSLLKCLWIRRDLSIATKIRVYRASVRSVPLYGCECWAVHAKDERKPEAFDHHCLRTILRVKFTDFDSNETVRAHCDNIARITQTIQERRLRWFGHVLRRQPQELDPAPLALGRRQKGALQKCEADEERKHAMRQQVSSLLLQHKPQMTISEAEERKLFNLRKIKNIVTLPADKGRSTVVMDKTEYWTKLENLLMNTESYALSDAIEFKKLVNNINKTVRRLKKANALTRREALSAKATDTSMVRFYGLPKVHKPGVPLRPIVSLHGTPTFGLSKWLYQRLCFLIKDSEWTVKSAGGFLTRIRHCRVEADEVMVSFDVVSVFTPIPPHLAIDTLDGLLRENTTRPTNSLNECTSSSS
nr:unnamed protein product [Spirometra erinaceieuropaei]